MIENSATDGVSRGGAGGASIEAWPAALLDDTGPGLHVVSEVRTREPSPGLQQLAIRSVAVLGIILSLGYLVWRVLFTIDWGLWAAAAPLLALEGLHALSLIVSTFTLWDVDPAKGWRPVEGTGLRVAVLIITSEEEADVLVPVIGAAVAAEPAHETWVVDATSRRDIEVVAEGLGARYLAGTTADAVEYVDADVVALVGADSILSPEFLQNTLGYFDDPGVAAVQTPPGEYDVDALKSRADRRVEAEDSLLWRVVVPARNRWNVVRWEGSGALLRVTSIRAVGGVAADSSAAELQTSVRLHQRGWKIVAHNEVLTRSLAPRPERGAGERRRDTRATRDALRADKPIFGRGLSVSQRIAYRGDGWLGVDALRALLFVAAPVTVLATGTLPVSGDLYFFAPLMFGMAFIQYAGLRALARGHYPSWRSALYGTPHVPTVLPTLGSFIRPLGVESTGASERARPPWLLIGLLALTGSTLVWGALTLNGLTEVTYAAPWAVYGTAVVLALEFIVVAAAINQVFHDRHANERRAAVRFDVDMAARLDGLSARVSDVSLTGARIRMIHIISSDGRRDSLPVALRAGQHVRLELTQQRLAFDARVTRVAIGDDGVVEVGVDFDDGQWREVHELSIILFHGVPVGEPGLVREHVHLLGAE